MARQAIIICGRAAMASVKTEGDSHADERLLRAVVDALLHSALVDVPNSSKG
jgi:hypothetical protein